LKKIFYYFLTHPVTTSMLFFSIVVLGAGALFTLPVELQPQTEMRKLSVSASWYGASPEAIEAQVTSVIESELATIRGIKNITSNSSESTCSISLDLHESVDMQFIRIEINEKLASLKKTLPYGVNPVIQEYKPEQFRSLDGFMTYEVSASLSANEIQRYLEQYVQYPLKAIDGVSDVKINGGNERQIQVLIDHDKAKNLGVTNETINNAISYSQRQLNAGAIKYDNNQRVVFAVNKLIDTDIIAEQIVKQEKNGTVVKLSDIAKVTDSFAEPRSFYRINGNDAVTIKIDREPGTNILDVAKNVKQKVDELGKKFPAGFALNLKLDKSEDMVKSLEDLYSSAGYSLLIIILVLFIIFKNFRYPVIILSSIIFSLAFSFIFFNLFKLHLNTLTISSFVLGLGFMVDNSIVVVDYIDKNYKGNGNKYLAATLKNIFFPVFASTLTTISVFIPVMYFTGELKIYFQQFALGVVFTLLASLAVSFTLVPLLHEKFAKKIVSTNERKSGYTYKVYAAIVRFFANHKKITIAIIILLVGLPVWKIPNRIETPVIGDAYNEIFDSELYQGEIKKYVNYAFGGTLNLFLNHVNRGEFYRYGNDDGATTINISLTMPSGNKIDRMNELVKNFEREILAYKGQFKDVVSSCTEEYANIRITFTPAQSESSFPYQLYNYIGAYGTRHGGLGVYVSGTNMGQGFSNGGFGSGQSFSSTVRVQGFNYKKVREIAENFKEIISKNPRVEKVDIENSGGGYYYSRGGDVYEVKGYVKRDLLARNNITIRQLFSEISRNTAGDIGSQSLQINNEDVPLNVKFENFSNIKLEELENRVIPSGKEQMKIKDFMDFKEEKALSSIYREDQQYTRVVAIEIKGPPQLCENIIEDAAGRTQVPEGYQLKFKSDYWRYKSEEDDIGMVLIFAVVLIYMITAGLFESFSKPFLVIFAVPFAIMGTVLLFFYGDYNIDRGAYAGMLLLIGLSVNNSIILIHHIGTHFYTNRLEDLIRLSYSRFRSIFTTTITTIAGLFPMMVSLQQSFWKSLALSVAGGIFLSALIVLVFLPAVYGWFKIKKEKEVINAEPIPTVE
jgi:hydrophobic/amphiphilic exporter-1 (mainly G- bacteria), HAE1 family